MFRHGHFAKVRQRMLERPPAHRQRTSRRLEPEDLALVVNADVLQVVEQPPLGRPEPAAARSSKGMSASTQRLASPFWTKRAFRSRTASVLERGPGRGPLGLVGPGSGLVCQSRPEDRRADGVAALGGRSEPRRRAARIGSSLSPGAAAGSVDLSRLEARLMPRSSLTSTTAAAREHRPAACRRAGPGRRDLWPAPPRSRRDLDRGEHDRQGRGLEVGQLKEHRREYLISRVVRYRGKQQAILPQDTAGLLELGPADSRDPFGEPGASITPDSNADASSHSTARGRVGARPQSE